MKKLLLGLAVLPLLAGIAIAGQPMSLNDGQMDSVTAGDIVIPNAGTFGQVVIVTNFQIVPGGTYLDTTIGDLHVRFPAGNLNLVTGFTVITPP